MTRLDDIRARADAAFDACHEPWDVEMGADDSSWYYAVVAGPREPHQHVVASHMSEEVANFLAGTRDDVPWLLAEVDRLTRDRDALAPTKPSRTDDSPSWTASKRRRSHAASLPSARAHDR